MIRRTPTTAPQKAATWVVGMPFGAPDGANMRWISALSKQLVKTGAKTVWGTQASPNQPRPPEGVIAYPYSDLGNALQDRVQAKSPLLHNADAPCPYADRTWHLWRSFDLGAQDVFFLPDAHLADLEALWNIYAFTNIARAPLTLLRLTRIAPAGTMSFDEMMERLRWAAYRLNCLDLAGKKVVIVPGSALIAQLLERAGLAATDPLPVSDAAPRSGTLLTLPTVGEDEQRLIAQLKASGHQSVDVICLSPADVVRLSNDASFDIHGINAQPDGYYSRIVTYADLAFAVAHAGVDCGKDCCFILDKADAGMWDAILAPAKNDDLPLALTPEQLAKRLSEIAAEAASHTPSPSAIVVHIAPAWPSAGSTHVFQSQLEWLHSRGLPVICLHLDTDDLDWHATLNRVPELLGRLPGNQALHRWFLSRAREERQCETDTATPAPYTRLSLEGEERISRQVRLPGSLIAFLKHRDVRFVVLNYGHNWPLVERLSLEKHPVALETHDIRPIQHGLYNNTPVIESAVDVELAMFARARCAVFINRHEQATFEKRFAKTPSVCAFPFRDAALPQTLHSRFETRATSILSLSQLPLEIVRDFFLPREERRRRFAVFVGSNHAANITSLQWFFLNAYPHGLVDPDLTILVAGAIHEAFANAHLPNVYFCGRMDGLELLYKTADVLLLPVTAGTGLPIKTLDALTARVPFVATSNAMEAIPGLTDLVGAHNDGKAFAARLRELAFDDGARNAFMERISDYCAQHANQGQYNVVWDGVLKTMNVEGVGGPIAPAPRRLVHEVDWPAGRLNQRYYFWEGHGLEELVGGGREMDGGLMLNAPYARLGLSCTPAFPLQAGGRLEVTARLSAREATRVLVAFQGKVGGNFALQAERPVYIALGAEQPPSGRPQRLSLEFRLESEGWVETSPVQIQQLSIAGMR
ncbi:MAG TPA: glycosyltransferase [Rhizomicrobium sp.]|jgi:hypothetical protein|nr:glycosyltransferase [Rhizomicrobium sp.]